MTGSAENECPSLFKHSVDRRVGQDEIRKNRGPLGDVTVGCEDERGRMLPTIQEIEDLFGDFPTVSYDTKIVIDPEFGGEDLSEEIIQIVSKFGLNDLALKFFR